MQTHEITSIRFRDCTPDCRIFYFMTHKEKYHAYLKSETWAKIKLDLISVRGNKCERCGNKRNFKYLHLHHLTYERVFKEECADLQLICAQCHAVEHGFIKPEKKKAINLNKGKRIFIKNLREKMMKKIITCESFSLQVKLLRMG